MGQCAGPIRLPLVELPSAELGQDARRHKRKLHAPSLRAGSCAPSIARCTTARAQQPSSWWVQLGCGREAGTHAAVHGCMHVIRTRCCPGLPLLSAPCCDFSAATANLFLTSGAGHVPGAQGVLPSHRGQDGGGGPQALQAQRLSSGTAAAQQPLCPRSTSGVAHVAQHIAPQRQKWHMYYNGCFTAHVITCTMASRAHSHPPQIFVNGKLTLRAGPPQRRQPRPPSRPIAAAPGTPNHAGHAAQLFHGSGRQPGAAAGGSAPAGRRAAAADWTGRQPTSGSCLAAASR